VDVFRDKEGNPGLYVGELERALHAEFLCQRVEGFEDSTPGDVETVELPLDPHEEDLGAFRRVLGGMDDVSAVVEDEVRHRGDDPLLVGAGQQQNGVWFHGGHFKRVSRSCNSLLAKIPDRA
jgi:hypothetical protein